VRVPSAQPLTEVAVDAGPSKPVAVALRSHEEAA
jgi:hypothetical protein